MFSASMLWTYCGPNDPHPKGHRGGKPYWYLDRPRRDRVQLTKRQLLGYIAAQHRRGQ